ncbi:SEA (Seh1-associated) complex subunit [Scheffersomyces spartinae]|uniref:Restriction of telomere capping protein 1 n=1 Tax=Scheffersomyces spartinae TaxID=45513 RepID=A0A9P7V594_9ASCO|nr:SEA (Seh1-associated) complex subunit [Scheffersomyces spartinae]KAG7191443.1 SEA (Seh1-associated) complex subunit [Scheffersomyces spartinae]
MSGSTGHHLSFTKFAKNFYGNLSQLNGLESGSLLSSPGNSFPSSLKSSNNNINNNIPSRSSELTYHCEREVTALSQLSHPINWGGETPKHHVVIGGKNYLKLLALDTLQTRVVKEYNLLDAGKSSSVYANHRNAKLNMVNTIKTKDDTIACGLSNGDVSIYRLSNRGSATLYHKLVDHRRTINSLDFVDDLANLLISGSQDGTIKFWDLRAASPKPMISVSFSNHSDPIRSCQYSPHSSRRNKLTILSVHDSGSLCKYDLRSNSNYQHLINNPERKWNFHTGPALSLHIHPEKEYVITGGRDKRMCVCSYGDSISGGTKAGPGPDFIINTYGPVMKVRWSNYPVKYGGNGSGNDNVESTYSNDDKLSYDEREFLSSASITPSDPLFHYDFACNYLNDDPTISVFNLRRKFIARDTIYTKNLKAFQNFIWANNTDFSRKLWSISKSNDFVSYDLDSYSDHIVHPIEDLNDVTLGWSNGFCDFSFVDQERHEFQINVETLSSINTEAAESVLDVASELAMNLLNLVEEVDEPLHNTVSIPITPGMASVTANPMDFISSNYSVSPKDRAYLRPQSYNNMFIPRPGSPALKHSNSEGVHNRPVLKRNPSQMTQASGHSASSLTGQKRYLSINYTSPYVCPVSIPLPLNDEVGFEIIARSYLLEIPDSFSLARVCLFNAEYAASANKFRHCQSWQALAIAVEDYHDNQTRRKATYQQDNGDDNNNNETKNFSSESLDLPELKSILSELGNLVGSFNSMSSLTTNNNYQELKDHHGGVETESEERVKIKNNSTSSLVEMLAKSRGNSFTSPNISRVNSTIFSRNAQFKDAAFNEVAIEDDDDEEGGDGVEDAEQAAISSSGATDQKIKGILTQPLVDNNSEEGSRKLKLNIDTVPPMRPYSVYSGSLQQSPLLNRKYSTTTRAQAFEDLDNEIPSSRFLFSSASSASPVLYGSLQMTHFGSAGPGTLSRRDSTFLQGSKMAFQRRSLQHVNGDANDVEEKTEQESSKVDTRSELTRAIDHEKTKEYEVHKPWKLKEILEQLLEYSAQQGDIIMCCTLCLLFYDTGVVTKEAAMEWYLTYVDILKRKRLFSIAAKVINSVPRALLPEIVEHTKNEVDLRFYCCHCQKLLLNEKSKHRVTALKVGGGEGEVGGEFGFWYCDNCNKMQLNCIYCNEPCKGLNVVVSLKCGHRGHFWCLREWFVEDENVDCPGGCGYTVVTT